MTKKNISIIGLVLLLVVSYFIFPDNLYLDYYLHYIKTASNPLFDWFVIMMGGISVNDSITILIVTLLIIYTFALFNKDKHRNTNISLKHVALGILGTALILRIIYFYLFALNGSTCNEYKTIKTPITEINGNKITLVIDSIPLSKPIDIALHNPSAGDSIEIGIGKGCMGFYCIANEFKLYKSAHKTIENNINKARPASEVKPESEAKPVIKKDSANKVVEKTKAPKEEKKTEELTSETVDAYDWYDWNEKHEGLIWMLIILFDIGIVAGIYFSIKKRYDISLNEKFYIFILLIIPGIAIIINAANITDRKMIKSVITNKKRIKTNEGLQYKVITFYHGNEVSRSLPEGDYNSTEIGDTLVFEVKGGIFRLNIDGNHYIIPSKAKRNLYRQNKSKYRRDNIISIVTKEKQFFIKLEELTMQYRKAKGVLSALIIVDSTADNHIKKIDIYRCPKEIKSQLIVDLINNSDEIKSFYSGAYIMTAQIEKGFPEEKLLKAIDSKEDFESLMFEFLYNKMPTVNGLRGSAFIDITVKADGTPEAVVTQSLNPKVDNVALEFVKNIPWNQTQNENKYRLTIMYAKGKLWQVKVWNMD